jgi:hypothetical protein
MNNGLTLEIARLCTDGTRNACSFLLSRAARTAKALGYRSMQIYTLADETVTSGGASLPRVVQLNCIIIPLHFGLVSQPRPLQEISPMIPLKTQ